MEEDALVVLVTAPSEDVAATLARALVDARAAGCVGILPGLRSIYRWAGEVHDEREVQLVIKTRSDKLDDVKRIVAEKHPAEVPELLALEVVDGSEDYLAWLVEQTA